LCYNDYPSETTWVPDESPGVVNTQITTDDTEDKQTLDATSSPEPHDPYQVVLVSCNSSVLYYDNEQALYDFMQAWGDRALGSSVVLKRRDGQRIPLAKYVQVAAGIDVLFCGCYSPSNPYKMELASNGCKTLLYLKYDTESG